MIKKIKKRVIALSLFGFALPLYADTTQDSAGITVKFSANLIVQSCSLTADSATITFGEIPISSTGYGSGAGYSDTTYDQTNNLEIECVSDTKVSMILQGTQNTMNDSYLALQVPSESKVALDVAIATYISESNAPTDSDLIKPMVQANWTSTDSSSVKSVSVTGGDSTALILTSRLFQVGASVNATSFTASATLLVRYE